MKKALIWVIAIAAVLAFVGCKGKKETGGTYEIGQKGPGGGIIFFVENGSYMECSAEDIGEYNWEDAISAAQNYKGGGFSDWRLPTGEELNLMYVNLKRNNVGGFTDHAYWSSSQVDETVWLQQFGNGYQFNDYKNGTASVRAVREVAASVETTETESGDNQGDLSLPPVINLFQYQNEYSPSNESGFRFWGWSKDGKVAYSYDFSDGGETNASFEIRQFMDNKVLFTKTYAGYYDDDGKLQPLDLDNAVYAYDEDGKLQPLDGTAYLEFEKACKEHGIVFTRAEYRQLPIVHNNKTYNVVVDIAKKEVSDGFFDSVVMVDNYRIFADTDGKRKVVREANAEEPTFNIFPLGYFISPFENKALLVMGRHIMGGYVWRSFVGCDLDRGFDTAAPVTFTVEEVSERTYQGGYVFEDEGAGAYIALTPSGMVTDFRYVSIGFHGDGLFEDITLFERPYIVGGQSFNVAWQASSIPQRGISYMDGGQRKYFYLQEDGMDGSIHLVEFTPTAFG